MKPGVLSSHQPAACTALYVSRCAPNASALLRASSPWAARTHLWEMLQPAPAPGWDPQSVIDAVQDPAGLAQVLPPVYSCPRPLQGILTGSLWKIIAIAAIWAPAQRHLCYHAATHCQGTPCLAVVRKQQPHPQADAQRLPRAAWSAPASTCSTQPAQASGLLGANRLAAGTLHCVLARPV